MEINNLTRTVIGCAYKVHNTLGFGFAEEVYENAMQIELRNNGIQALKQEPIDVFYSGHLVGHFKPDLWLPEKLIVEVKSVRNIAKEHEVQLVNYLVATKIDDGLLINFGTSVEVRRKFREYHPRRSLIDSLIEPTVS